MTDIVVDVEADGPFPGTYSMVSLGAVAVRQGLAERFTIKVAPIGPNWIDSALAISGFTREEHEKFPSPHTELPKFRRWIENLGDGRKTMWSDNPAFDWQFVNYYLHRYAGGNPLGWSARRIGDVYCGLVGDLHARWKHLRETKHDHDPLNDALANAEALLKIKKMVKEREAKRAKELGLDD